MIHFQSIKEDQSSTSGQSPVPFGYNSETGTDTMVTAEYNIRSHMRPSTGSDDDAQNRNVTDGGSGGGSRGGGDGGGGGQEALASMTHQSTWDPPPKSQRRRSSSRRHGHRRQAEKDSSTGNSPAAGRAGTERSRAWGSVEAPSSSDEEEVANEEEVVRAHRQPEVGAPRQGDGAMSERLQCMEERLGALEEKTTRSLHNIETMLRNAVFNRGAVAMPPSEEPPNYALQDAAYRGARVVAPPRDWAAQPPYRRNLHFPP